MVKTAGHNDILSKSIQKPLEIIAASSSSTQDFLSKLTQIQSSNQEKTSNSFGKLLDRVQNMIHVASSRGNVISTTLSDEPLTPSGYASSVISLKDIIFNDSLHEGIMVDFSTKHEITKSSLTKLTKTQVMYPSPIELMIERVEAIAAFANLFFTEKSYLTKSLNHLLILCIKLIRLY